MRNGKFVIFTNVYFFLLSLLLLSACNTDAAAAAPDYTIGAAEKTVIDRPGYTCITSAKPATVRLNSELSESEFSLPDSTRDSEDRHGGGPGSGELNGSCRYQAVSSEDNAGWILYMDEELAEEYESFLKGTEHGGWSLKDDDPIVFDHVIYQGYQEGSTLVVLRIEFYFARISAAK